MHFSRIFWTTPWTGVGSVMLFLARCWAVILMLGLGHTGVASGAVPGRRVVVIIWDGMRPDFVSEQNTPALFKLAHNGVTFRNHHSVYLSSTEVNGTAISTGVYPAHSGIIGNNEYRPRIDPLRITHTEMLDYVRKGDALSGGRYLQVPTIAELVKKSGGKTLVIGAKAVALLHDRLPRTPIDAGVTVFAGATLPSDLSAILTNRYGPFPPEDSVRPRRNDWITHVLLEHFWSRQIPDFTLVWMNEPDWSQHQSSPGSERSLAGLRNADDNLARILQMLEKQNLRESTDILVVSDHGASTVGSRMDLAEALTRAGLKSVREFEAEPSRGEILVVSNGGSSYIYVMGQEQRLIKRVVEFLQSWEHTGVIFTKEHLPGTFSLREVRIDSGAAPDIAVAWRWSGETNRYGTAGFIGSDLGSFAPGQGSHVTLSPFDLHATLIASGPDFRSGIVNTLASGNVDIAPTVLWILGLKPKHRLDGRVLTEALVNKGPPLYSFEPRHIEASVQVDGGTWRQYLNFTEVNGVRYLEEGNGGRIPNH